MIFLVLFVYCVRDLTIAVIKEHSKDILAKRGVLEPQIGVPSEDGISILEVKIQNHLLLMATKILSRFMENTP